MAMDQVVQRRNRDAFPSEQRFPKNNWYAAAADSEVTNTILHRKINGEDMVLYRRLDGTVSALRNACPHKGFPLSKSRVVGDEVECGYHGIRFAGDGRCTKIPSQKTVPSAMNMRAYPVVEKWRFVWVWTGDPDLADPATVPFVGYEGDPSYHEIFAFSEVLEGNAQFLMENMLDHTHFSYLHAGGLDNAPADGEEPEFTRFPQQVERRGHILRAWRDIPGFRSNPNVEVILGVKAGTVTDRIMDSYVIPASAYLVGLSRFTDPQDGDRIVADTVTTAVVTPVDDSHCLHIVFWCTSFVPDPRIADFVVGLIEQDKIAIADLQRHYEFDRDAREVTIAADKASMICRRMVVDSLAADA